MICKMLIKLYCVRFVSLPKILSEESWSDGCKADTLYWSYADQTAYIYLYIWEFHLVVFNYGINTKKNIHLELYQGIGYNSSHIHVGITLAPIAYNVKKTENYVCSQWAKHKWHCQDEMAVHPAQCRPLYQWDALTAAVVASVFTLTLLQYLSSIRNTLCWPM